MEQQTTRCLGGTCPEARRDHGRRGWRLGGSYVSTSDSASSQANTSSTARTTMLRNGFLQTGPRPAPAAASAASGGSIAELSE